jgi:hypothetical protein
MVTFNVLSEYSQDPPTEFGRSKISVGPLYDLARVQALAEDEDKLLALTKKCRNDVDKFFAGDYAEVAELIKSLKDHDYIDSEWCESGSGGIAACDAYKVRRVEEVPGTGKRETFAYFLKFAIGKAGNLVLVVSCHTS